MKTLFLLASLIGGGFAYFKYTAVPEIEIKSVNYDNMTLIAVVRGKEVSIDAGLIFRTGSSLVSTISFSKYTLTAQRNQVNIDAPAVLRVSITDGDTIVGQSKYVDFVQRSVE